MKGPRSKDHSRSQGWLFGVPKKMATRWWRIIFWRGTMDRHHVPKPLRTEGVYCPLCRKGQSFSDRCAFCKCDFSYFVIISATRHKKQPKRTTAPHDLVKLVACNSPSASLQTLYNRISEPQLRYSTLAVSLVFLLLISVAIGITSYQRSLHENFSQNYVLALYGINSGITLTDKVRKGEYKAWQEGIALTDQESNEIDSRTISDLIAVKAEIDSIMKTIGKKTTEYDQAAQRLQQLHEIYAKINALIVTSPDSLSRNEIEIDTARKDYFRKIESLKANLPAPIANEVLKVSQKYDMSFMTVEK